MGIFDLFGGKKSAEKAAAEAEQEAAKAQERRQKEQHEAHADLTWPTIQPLNPIKVAEDQPESIEDPVTLERKNELGEMIYEEHLSPESVRFLPLQELLFVLTVLEFYHAKAPLDNFQSNHRVLYNELLNRIRDAQDIFVLYDQSTGYPFIDNGFANIYLEQERAQAAADAFGHQFRKLAVRECKGENSEEASSKRGFFDYLYYLGIERIIIDTGWYRAHFRRNEIVAPPNWAEDKKMPPANPALAFSMLDFLGEVRWPVKYEKRMQVLQAKELRMLSLAMVGHYIVPIQHEGPAEVMEDGRIHFNKDTKLKFPVMKNAEGKIFLPVFTDGVEFSKKFGKGGFEGGVFGFQDVLRFIQDKEGFVINPMGQNIMIPKDRILALQAAAQAAEAAKAADPAVQTGQETAQKDTLSETEDAAKNATAENTADTVK